MRYPTIFAYVVEEGSDGAGEMWMRASNVRTLSLRPLLLLLLSSSWCGRHVCASAKENEMGG